jgi:hypothetical protein
MCNSFVVLVQKEVIYELAMMYVRLLHFICAFITNMNSILFK